MVELRKETRFFGLFLCSLACGRCLMEKMINFRHVVFEVMAASQVQMTG